MVEPQPDHERNVSGRYDAAFDRGLGDAGSETTHGESLRERLLDAAIEAELATGRREETIEEAVVAVRWRLARIVAGFTLLFVGILAVPLPGPGWLIIVAGLSLLPYAWAERTVVAIRRRIPGIPDDGRIPGRTWVAMGVGITVVTAASLLWADDVKDWVTGLV